MRQCRLGKIKKAENVGSKDLLNMRRVQFFHPRYRILLPGIVYQNINFAISIYRSLHHFLAKIRIRQIPVELDDPAPEFLNPRDGKISVFMFIQINDAYVRAFFCEEQGNRTSDSVVASGNNGNFAL
jgi:hypothetical protein